MTIYYVYKHEQTDSTCHSSGRGVIESFQNHGCIPLNETQFLEKHSDSFNKDDVIVIYISFRDERCHQKLSSINCTKILHSIDESKSDEILFRTQLEFCHRHKVNTIINTYPSKRNLDFLAEREIRTITLPLMGSKRDVDYSKKDIDVIVSGQIVANYYPIRSKILESLKNSNIKYVYLPHSGMETSKATHQYHGVNFLSLLDRCWMGVTCKAGSFRDRMVAKYIEFGFSKVLPVGDCPTYMIEDMKNAMVEINESDDPSLIISKIKDALNDKERLIQRIEKYSLSVSENHDYDNNVKRVISMILNGKRDS